MGLKTRRVDHDPVRFASASGQFGEDPVEYSEPASAHKPVVDRLVRPIALGGIPPHQSMLDDIDDAQNDPPVIGPWNAMGEREEQFDPAHLRFTQQKRNVHNQLAGSMGHRNTI